MPFDRTSRGIRGLGASLTDFGLGLEKRQQAQAEQANHKRFMQNAFDLLGDLPPDPAMLPEQIEPASPGLLDYGPDGAPSYMDGRAAPTMPNVPRRAVNQGDLFDLYAFEAQDPAQQNLDFLKQITDILNQSARTEGMLDAAGLRAEASRYGAGTRADASRYGADRRYEGQVYGADRRLDGVEDTNDSREGMNSANNATRLQVERMRAATSMARAAQVKSTKDRVSAITDPGQLERMLAETEAQIADHVKDAPVPENYDSFDGVQREAYEQNAVYWHKIDNDLRGLRNAIRIRQSQIADDAAAVPPPAPAGRPGAGAPRAPGAASGSVPVGTTKKNNIGMMVRWNGQAWEPAQ